MKLKNSLKRLIVVLVFLQTGLQNVAAAMDGNPPMKRKIECDNSTGIDVGPTKRTFKIDDTEVPFYLRDDSPNELTRSNAIDVRKTRCGFCMGNMISVLEESKTEPSKFGENDIKPKLAEEERNEKLALIKKMLLTNGHDTLGSDQTIVSSFKVGRKKKVSQPKRILTNTADNETLKERSGSISKTTYLRSNAALQNFANQQPQSLMSRNSITSNSVDSASNVNSFMISELSTPLFRNSPSNINRYGTPKMTHGYSNKVATISYCDEEKNSLHPTIVVPYFSGGVENSLIHKNKKNYHQDSDNEMDDEWYENAKTEPTSQDDDDL